ncbi:LPXTG-motif cell wall anchor domain protein [Cellulomonas gilvus ATCC 13127]|uniref:LPXTG-motif cell wall anchor domain protein n=2 Tax=Cellulomonas gilvus TaxID=11 RepID=F8A277_CELGA|nr:LPXTG-motif cell wall anchor domain protein [Cellulomonas gilvus ATCC 13127]
MVALLVALVTVPMTTVPAAAADPQYLALTKTVSQAELAPGDSYTYRVQVTCSEASCLDAVLVDTMGDLAGHTLTGVTFKASQPALTYAATWTSAGVTSATAPTTIAADTQLRVAFTQPTVSPTGTGIQAGLTFTVDMTVKVPTDLAPGTDVTLDNDATVTASNSAPADDSATVHVVVPIVVDVATTKTWSPASQAFDEGGASAIAISTTNASNARVDRLVLQEPAAAPDGASALPATNPFRLVDLDGLASSAVPAQCSTVRVDAYVLAGGAWRWVLGDPDDGVALPAGVAAADVAGVRITCEGDLPVGARLALDLDVTQRATDRVSGTDLSTATHSVTNVVSGTAALAGHAPVTRSAQAPYQVVPARLGTQITKDFSPQRVSAGQSSTLSLVAAQTSDVAVAELRVADLGFFGVDPSFGGFATAPQWPTGATAASVVYHLSDGGTQEVGLARGEVPAGPSTPGAVHVTGFEVVFTGVIAPNADPARLEVAVGTVERTTGAPASFDNTATVTVTAPNGTTATGTDTARLTELPASIGVDLVKTVRPGTAVRPGDRAVVELETDLRVSSSYVTADELTVTDAWDGAATGFWNAFDLEAVAPTQVPSGVAVEVQVQTAVGTWVTVATEPARGATWLLELDAAALTGALPPGVDLRDVTGVRFAFTDADGFEENVTVVPYLVTTARGTLRTGGPLATGQTALTNAAAAQGSGETDGGTPVTGGADAGDDGVVEPTPPGVGDVSVDKRWSSATVAAQSGQQRSTTLTWRSRTGLSAVAISDPAAPAAVADTVFDAFDLVRVRPVATSSTPFSNGWYLRYDRVTAVELFLPDGAGGFAWATVAPPAGGWTSSTGFVGLTLSAQQRADARGVRVVLEEDTAAREAARELGAAFDPFAPAPGTGVAAASTDRAFVLDWQVRQVRRSAQEWVTGTTDFGTGEPGVVRNTVEARGTRLAGGPDAVGTDHDDIVVTDAVPLVVIAKSVTPTTPLYVPRPDTVDAGSWPVRTFTITARNDSVAKASYVRVTDPACSDFDVQQGCALAQATADPFAATVDWLAPGSAPSMFDRFDLTRVQLAASVPAEVDLTRSVAWLLRYDGTGYTSESTTAAALVAMTPAQLADVVGVSVTFQGTDPATTGGTISRDDVLTLTLTTRLRTHLRSSGEVQQLAAGRSVDVENHAYAQSYDPVLAPTALAAGTDDAHVPLTGGDIDVLANKSISPATLTAPRRAEPLTVTLGATQATSTLAPAEVRLRDDVDGSPDFWDRFDLVGLGAISLPAGADRVRVDVLGPFGADGVRTWVSGTAATPGTVQLPVSGADLARVQGIRFTFLRADGGFFSRAIPAPGWTASAAFTVRLRDETREDGTAIAIDTPAAPVQNTVVVQSDRLTGEVSEERSRSAVVTLSEGTHRLAVSKLANEGDRTVDVGTAVPWDLRFTNTGTGYLTVTELRDQLPPSLVWTGEAAPVVTTDDDGQMSDDVTVDRDGSDLVLTWPQDGRTLDPGESVTVRLMLELQPGLAESDRATNTMTVTTAQPLDACTPLDPTRPVTGAWAQDPTTCGATDHVSPRGGPNLFTVKGVRGSVPGAATAAGQECAPLVHATGGDYYRTPCIARSQVGGTDDWVLRVVNGGTTSVEDLTVFDPLAAPDDAMIISGASRGSAFRPQLVAESLHVTAPAGATVVTEVTTTAASCRGTWTGLPTSPVCEQNGEQWAAVGPTTPWDSVTGLRVRVDLRTTPAGALLSGQFVDVTFSSTNVLADADADADSLDGVPAGPAADDVVAWNQFGVKYRDLGATGWKTIAPAKMGVEVLTGPLEVRKAVTGPAAAFAPTSFTANVVCTLDGTRLDLGADAELTLDDATGYLARIDGLPVGTECDVTESGAPGDAGEAERTGPVHVVIAAPAAAQDDVPTDQVATLTNTYLYSGLSVTKRLDTAATAGVDGPFSFTLSCTVAVTGETVLFDGAPELRFDVRAGQTFTTPPGTIPARATCGLRETERGGAERVVVVGDGVVETTDGQATVVVGVVPGEVTVTNGFDAGVLEVRKVVDGDGAAQLGAGPFGFSAVCTSRGVTVLDEEFTLRAGESRTFGTYPVGTACTVQETSDGGATRVTTSPADGLVRIDAPASGEAVSTAVVTVTNTFDVTSLDVVKEIAGDPTADGAAGPFVVELACTWRDAELAVPGGAERVLRAPTLRARYTGLPVGASCVLTETETGGAERTTWTVTVDGTGEITGAGVRVSVDGLATTTAPGQAVVRLVNHFAGNPPVDPPVDPPVGPPADPDGPSGELPLTGLELAGALGALVALLVAGVGLVLISRTRRRPGRR